MDKAYGFSRRRLLGAGAAAAGMTGLALTAGAGTRDPTEPFYGVHQSGVGTPPQAYATFIAMDLNRDRANPRTLAAVMKLWTEDASRLTQGRPALADTEPELATEPSRLTVTVGWGPELFDAVGLTRARPASLKPLPAFSVDRLQSHWCGGHLLLQVCADSLLTVSHACRVLTKNVKSMATVRWIQRGYRNRRNLMGQVDGTVNLDNAGALDRYVWDSAGGTTIVLRRIRAEMDAWDKVDRKTKELVVGRTLDTGAPLTGRRESDEPDFAAQVNGIKVIPENAHIALAHRRADGEQFLRRPYNYDDTDCGLIFASYQRDPATQFVPVQRRLADADALNPWITPIGSAVFGILPGVAPGEYLGQAMLGAP
jgi:dye decolorizing peroxidase